jgi:hypothetical protein
MKYMRVGPAGQERPVTHVDDYVVELEIDGLGRQRSVAEDAA